jgi:hypothetical protein
MTTSQAVFVWGIGLVLFFCALVYSFFGWLWGAFTLRSLMIRIGVPAMLMTGVLVGCGMAFLGIPSSVTPYVGAMSLCVVMWVGDIGK